MLPRSPSAHAAMSGPKRLSRQLGSACMRQRWSGVSLGRVRWRVLGREPAPVCAEGRIVARQVLEQKGRHLLVSGVVEVTVVYQVVHGERGGHRRQVRDAVGGGDELVRAVLLRTAF